MLVFSLLSRFLKNMKSYLMLFSIVFCGALFFALIFFGCESDPILSPQSEETEEKGSYGFSVFPGGDKKEHFEPGEPQSNPELF